MLRYDSVFRFGSSRRDGSIQIPLLASDGGVVEASYFVSSDKAKDIYVISTQSGCPLRCQFCELGQETFKGQLTADEIVQQIEILVDEVDRSLFHNPDISKKLTFANTGEPLHNMAVSSALNMIRKSKWNDYFSSVKISTLLPKGRTACSNFLALAAASESFPKPVQLQISLVSLNEDERNRLTGNAGATFAEILALARRWHQFNPERKINLSLIDCAEQQIHSGLLDLFPPELFRFRIRSYVPTVNGGDHRLQSATVDVKLLEALGYEVSLAGEPTAIEKRFGLAANVTRRRYLEILESSK